MAQDLKYDFLTDAFTQFETVETPKVEINLPLMDKPLDISDWATRVTDTGTPIIKPQNDRWAVNNPVQQEIYNDYSTGTQLPADKSKTAILLIDKLINKGIKPHEAAGIVGNLYAESGFKSTVTANDLGQTGGGLAGFRGENLIKLKNFAKARGKHWGDVDTQLDYIISTISPEVQSKLASSKNPHEASEAWAYYERYAGYDGTTKTARKAGWSQARVNQEHRNRSNYSKQFYDTWLKSKS